MPAPLVVAPIVASALAWLSRMLMIKAAAWIIGVFIYLGIYLGTHEFLIEPLIDQVRGIAENNTSASIAQWVSFLNLDRAITMILSAYTAAGAISATKVALFKRT